MKIFISCDLEGIAGVVTRGQTRFQGKDYDKARCWMTGEVNAVIEAALDAGAKKVLVNDAHGDMSNILLDELNPKASIISGRSKPLGMMQGAQDKFDAAVFIGYHARMGTLNAVLDHTIYSRVVYELRINNRVFGETGINALIAGYYKTPVVLVAGDEATTREARRFLGVVETVTVKRGISRYAAETIHPKEAEEKIKEAAYHAFRNLRRYKPFMIPPPLRLSIRFMDSGMADEAALIPGTRRIDARQVSYRARNIIELCKTGDAMITLAATTLPPRT